MNQVPPNTDVAAATATALRMTTSNGYNNNNNNSDYEPTSNNSPSPMSISPPTSEPNNNGGSPPSILHRVSKRVRDRVGTVVETGKTQSQKATRKLSVGSRSTSIFTDEDLKEIAGPVTRQKQHDQASSDDNDGVDGSRDVVTNAPPAASMESATAAARTSSIDSLCIKDSNTEAVIVPEELQSGVSFLKITHRKRVNCSFSIDPETGVVSWDSKSSAKLLVDKIYQIRTAEDAKNYREELKVSSTLASKWASIIYTDNNDNNKLKTLHILGVNQREFDLFIRVLRKFVKYRQDLMSGLAMPGDKFVNVHWSRFVDSQERLSFETVEKLTKRLHINCSRGFLEKKFHQADEDSSGYLDFKEFQVFVKLMKAREEITQIFDKYADIQQQHHHGRVMSFDAFNYFIRVVQKEESMFDQRIKKLFNKFASEEDHLVHSEGFADFLFSPKYFKPTKPVEEEMTRPLNEYFISSSHNTYLLGRQVAGESSVEPYIRVLQNGCRCVEIDCWDGDIGPIVCHGRTFTSSVDFRDVVNTIRKYGFIFSPYPLIISLEVHCNPENQLKMVDILKESLGEYLITEPLMSNYLVLPSPMELKHKILIKVKSSSITTAAAGGSYMSGNNSATSDSLSSDTTIASSTTTSVTDWFSDDNNNPNNKLHTDSNNRQAKKDQTKIIQPLADLGVYCSGIKFRNFSLPISKTVNHIFSLSERVANSMLRDHEKRPQFEKHNKRFLMRIYPSGYRVTSKNFDPIQYWKNGVQMVALNWQTNDIGLQINDALFDSRAGYVLKPSEILPPEPTSMIGKYFRRFAHSPSVSTSSVNDEIRLDLTVISAQQLPRPSKFKNDESFDPYVVVELFGNTRGCSISGSSSSETPTPTTSTSSLSKLKRNHDTSAAITAASRFRTQSVINNGYNPVWNSQWTVNIRREDYQFTFIRFSVNAGSDNMFAVYTARLCNLAEGYRHLPLHDLQGEEYIFSTLFIKSLID